MAKKAKPEAEESKLSIFEFHGVNFRKQQGKQHQGDCPFCDESNHFFVNEKTGQFDCKKCGVEGNAYGFLKQFHAFHLKQTKKEHYEALAELRGLTWQWWKNEKVAFDAVSERFLIPVKNLEGNIANLAAAFEHDGKFQTWGTKGCAAHLFGGEAIKDFNGTIYFCEGYWKRQALRYLLQKNEVPESSYIVTGSPGAATFKKPWVEALTGKEVVFCYDNNAAGNDGAQKAMTLLNEKAKSLRFVKWPDDTALFPEGYDVRKLVMDRMKKPKGAWKDLQAMMIPYGDHKPKKTLKRDTFNAVLKDFKARVHVTETFKDALLVAFAVCFSVRLPDDAVWLFLVGPPGSGKSLLIQSFAGSPHCESTSKLTSTSLVSGWRGGGDGDASLLPKLKNRTLLVKDYTTIKGMPSSVQEDLYGMLRDCYDRNVVVPYGTGETKRYKDINFSMLAGVTHIIHGDNRATLGERFLKFEILDTNYDPELQIRAAITNVIELIDTEEYLQASVEAFLEKPVDLEKLPTVPDWVTDRVVALVQIASYLRACVHRVAGDLSARPEAEIGTRLGKQLIKLGRCLAFTLDKEEIDEECYRIMEKVTFDTVIGWSLEIVEHLQDNEDGCRIRDIATHLQVSYSFVQKKMNDLQELRVVVAKPIPHEGKGRPELAWHLTDKFRELWNNAQVKRKRSGKRTLEHKPRTHKRGNRRKIAK